MKKSSGASDQGSRSGPAPDGQPRQGHRRRRKRGGRGRRGGRGQNRNPENQKQQDGADATHTVRTGDGTAGATSRQSSRHPRTPNRTRSGSGQAASASTTRSGPPARSGAKTAATSGAKPGNKTGTKPGNKAGNKAATKNTRGGRAGGRHPRGGQRLRTVTETSAGGLVVRGLAAAGAVEPEPDLTKLRVALIGRLDRRGRMLWSMPKGHIEPGETVAETARREVLEETGVDGTILAPLGTIDYWFVAEGRRIHKTVHHHLIRYDHGELCDEDPEITEVAWVPFEDLPRRLAYPDERRLVETARTLLPELARDERAGRGPVASTAQVVDPSRRADGPEPVRRSGRGRADGQNNRQNARQGGRSGGSRGSTRGGQNNGHSGGHNGGSRRRHPRPSAPAPRDDSPEESAS